MLLLKFSIYLLLMKLIVSHLYSWPCSNERLAYSVKAYHLTLLPGGDLLTFAHAEPSLVQHPCERSLGGFSPAIFLGPKVFVTLDGFESSLLPLAIPPHLIKAPGVVTDAVFVLTTRILLVINGQVFIYFYKTWKSWKLARGINKAVTKLSNDYCCYDPDDLSCNTISKFILAYDTGNLASNSHIFYSVDGGYIFEPLESRSQRDGHLIGVYSFASTSEIGMLINKTDANSTTAYFVYGNLKKMNNVTGAPIQLLLQKDEEVLSVLPPGLRGFITFWTKGSFVSSPNNGLTTENISVIPTDKYSKTSLPVNDEGICFMTASATEIAAITKDHLFYGSLDMVFSQMVHIGQRNTSSTHCDVMMFENTGLLNIINPVPDKETHYFHFQKCTINIQDRLMSLRPPLQPCPVEILSGNFHNKMYYIDTKQELHFNVTFVPKPGTTTFPYVMVSNPRVLEFRASLEQDGFTPNGNAKYSLRIKLIEQQYSVTENGHSENNSLTSKVSSITVDIYNKGIFCVDMHPLTALIAVDCPPKKHIKIVKTTTACHKGLYNPRFLQNLTYSISSQVYDPQLLGREYLVQGDLNITYRYDIWGCPLLLYYDIGWLPVLELWENDQFVEYVSADFVIIEVNGMHNYDYLLNEVDANCLSASQNWTTMIKEANDERTLDDAWSKHNYRSCKEYRGNESLPSTSSKYQVLNKNENNRILFPQYNGIYIFKVTVVDAFYSYCELTTVFSVYVHGALPKSEINPGKTLISFLVLIFGSILMVYYFPKLLKENARMRSVWSLDLGL